MVCHIMSQTSSICLGLRVPGINLKTLLPSSSSSSSSSGLVSFYNYNYQRPSAISANSSNITKEELREMEKIPSRRSGNYPPVHWDFDYVQSLKNEFHGEKWMKRRELLKEKVRRMLDDEEGEAALKQLELIEDLQRLGVCYHFNDRIKTILSDFHNQNNIINCTSVLPNIHGTDLYATALAFRLMRQHGFYVSQEVFDRFKDEKGSFKVNLCNDIKGILQLYEASYLLTENESTLESAREFAAKHLQNSTHETGVLLDRELALLVQHANELPLHRRVPRVEARWFIDLYEKRLNKNLVLLEFAKLDFNIVQAIHQTDLQDSSRWWESTCLGRKLNFARNRLIENFFWTIGVNFEPEYGYCRRIITKVNALITTIDDVYDVYGTLDELELFTNAVERWNVEVIAELPDYMKICYLALYNATNEMAYDAMTKQGFNIIPHLRKVWADLCKSYLQEAKWYHGGYTPTLKDYLDNAWMSISAPVILVHAYFCGSNPITDEALESLRRPYHSIILHSAMILRLANDLGTSSEELKRGDVPKAVECYMTETGVSEKEARKYIKFLISETWKKLNKERVPNAPFPQVFIGVAMNLARMAQCMYEYGDGHGHSNSQTNGRIQALLFEPIAVS